MNQIRKRKMIAVFMTSILLFVTVLLVLYALRQNISLFYTPEQLVQGAAPISHDIRIGGMVVENSIKHDKGLRVLFKVTDYKQTVDVEYSGVLPDLFREKQGVVVLGKAIDNHHFLAQQILAKHDENYMPPEVKSAITKKSAT